VWMISRSWRSGHAGSSNVRWSTGWVMART
jgi:hypothetical protein